MNEYLKALRAALPKMDRATILRLVLHAPCAEARFLCANHLDMGGAA